MKKWNTFYLLLGRSTCNCILKTRVWEIRNKMNDFEVKGCFGKYS